MPSYKPNKTSFKKGVSGNPSGGPKLPDDLRLLMRATSEQMKRDICEVYAMPLKELLSFSDNMEGLSAGRAAVMSCLNNSIQTGDDKALKAMFDRVLGKVPEADLTGNEDKPLDQSKDAVIDKLVKMLGDKK